MDVDYLELVLVQYLDVMIKAGLVVNDGEVVETLSYQLQLQALHRLSDELRVQTVTRGHLHRVQLVYTHTKGHGFYSPRFASIVINMYDYNLNTVFSPIKNEIRLRN